jgi:CHRD domain
MRTRLVVAAFVLGLVAVGIAVAGTNRNWSTHANGATEVPVRDTNAQGQATFQLSTDGSSLHFKLIVANIENVTQAHIHLGPPTETGNIVVWLYPSGPPAQLIPGRSDGVLAEGTITSEDLVNDLAGAELSALVDAMNAGLAYVNVHTTQFPPGEIRGNLD